MRRLFALMVSMLLWQQTALGQLGENTAPVTPEFAHVALTQTMARAMATRTQSLLTEGMETYHSGAQDFATFVTANGDKFSKADQKFLNELQKNFPSNITLPKFHWRGDRYEASALGTTIAFSPVDFWQNRIYVNGQLFQLNYEKGLAAIYKELQQKFPQKTSMNLFIEDANAFIPLVVWLGIFVAGALGLSFWMKSKAEKKRIIEEALVETSKDIQQQAQRCEQSRNDSAAYEDTFGLLTSMITGDGSGNMVSKALHVGMFKSIEEESSLDCTESFNKVLEETLGGVSALNAAARQAKAELCGGVIDASGSFDRLRTCIARFYSTHKEITVRRRNITPSRYDSDAELIRDSNQYRNAVR